MSVSLWEFRDASCEPGSPDSHNNGGPGIGKEFSMSEISDNCRFCGEPLTPDEQKILKDQCFDCTEQVAN